jgi:hypothetical protein
VAEAEREKRGAKPEERAFFASAFRSVGRVLAACTKRSSFTLGHRTPGGRGANMEYSNQFIIIQNALLYVFLISNCTNRVRLDQLH